MRLPALTGGSQAYDHPLSLFPLGTEAQGDWVNCCLNLVENQICVAPGWVTTAAQRPPPASAAGVVMLAQRPCSETCHLACTETMPPTGLPRTEWPGS